MSEVETHHSAEDAPRAIGRPTSGRRGRRRGIEIKAGTVKQARFEAGLSLAQVAAGQISRTAIYFVETGKARPSIETLKLIADRTGRPLDYFLASPSTMESRSSAGTTELERLITVGEHAGALTAGEALLATERDPDTRAQIKHLMATAHLRLAQWVPARRLASTARAHFESTGDLLMTAECLGSEASAAYMMQDPGALALAEGALATCRLLNPVPQITESRLLGVLGSAYTANHSWQKAIDTFEMAIAAGEIVHDLRRLSLTYGGLSWAYQETGQDDKSAHYARRAIALHEALNDRLSLARTENNLALLLLRQGNPVDARRHLLRSITTHEEAGVEAGKATVILSLSELELAESNLDEATRYANQALELAGRLSENHTVGDSHVWLGLIAAARGDDAAADDEFAAAFEILEKPGMSPDRASRTHARYADLLESRGDMFGAVKHLKRALAARSDQRAIEAAASA
ncbi:MAG TPA: tetratricopeptide repeat protein [Candidatus Dormibacteraeota bacterium]|jgi:tetratricopeptide (TPR) repeat protein/DNA-binding XRE family transcriptional regulator|nr:tetratricopeptide repeat protein [Candidatus Dormibacteraeota bacterium]